MTGTMLDSRDKSPDDDDLESASLDDDLETASLDDAVDVSPPCGLSRLMTTSRALLVADVTASTILGRLERYRLHSR